MKKTASAKATETCDVIATSMPIQEIVTLLPEAKNVLAEYGLHCFSCAGSAYETLGEGCRGHGFSDEEIDELVDDLNQMLHDLPARPGTLILTLAGARTIRKVAGDEGRSGQGLAVIADAAGGFCMEFRAGPDKGDRIFTNADEPDVLLFASALTLKRIGGATIDFREGRFKLDLPEDAPGTGCGCAGGSCGYGEGSCGCREGSCGC